MTAGNNGASTPEDDDPFGYLYEDGQAAGAVPPPGGGGYGYPGPTSGGQPGVPRTSYNQVRAVGERQYGQQQAPQQAYGQPQQGYGQNPQYGQPPQQQYGQPAPQYAAPETYPGGPPPQRPPQNNGGGRGGGPNHKGLLIGAVAVVAVVVIGIGAALVTNGDDKNKDAKAGGTGSGQTSSESVAPSDKASPPPSKAADLPKQDAATLKLDGGAITDKTVKGAQGPDGSYINGFNNVGASVTWQANVEKAGDYKLSVRYAIPAQDANATLTVNDKVNGSPLGLKNFINGSDPDWAKNWQTTWAPVTLKQGENTIKLSCEDGNQCNAILDWLQIKPA
ncbi:carbohydrate-binding protein [Streptomyces sp. NBC_01387]|uniref:CBM35 domain-containing protein n=1 Tax=unclassified Streptomyces TaxID=2593676 RepID=UPI002DDC2C26|nr:CBM35 domain-containing protein [Streptomyces sp. NBC_01766]WSC21551.1 carbohydrate-binding protein [Streptomyces sp. NBC_01766]